ncbi:hypothetical protein ACFYYP_32415 [Microbispora rosea]|uniref:hypothetical protein n=1 Tax=Microbispora rosea TaxID=58117 RepID=UPI0036B1432E
MTVVYVALSDLVDPDTLPLGGLVAEAVDGLLIGPMSFTPDGIRWALLIQDNVEFTLPGLDFITLAIGVVDGATPLTAAVDFSPGWVGVRDVPLTMGIANDVVRPVRDGSWDVAGDEPLVLTLGKVDVGLSTDGAPTFALSSGFALPRCRIGELPIVVSATDARWCTADAPPTAPNAPSDFVGLHLREVAVELVGVGKPGVSVLKATDFLIGTGGVTGRVDLQLPSSWDGSKFSGPAAVELFGFDGCLTSVHLEFVQGALTACDVQGNVRLPFLDRVIGLSLGFGAAGLTAVARTPTCTYTGPAATGPKADAGPSGYLLTVPSEVGTLDLSRVELTVGPSGGSVALSGRIAINAGGLDIPPVVFKGLRIGSDGRVAIEGGWLDVDTARSASLKGFPLQITKVGFGAEPDGRRWAGLNGGIKLVAPLPVGASVEGLRVSWDPGPNGPNVRFHLGGIGVEVASPGTFSFAGKVAFFDDARGSGFRGSIKLKLTTVGVETDASIVVGRTPDGTTFFFLYLDLTLPAGIPLFGTGAAIYGFAGLLAINLKPDRRDGEHWYHGYYRRAPVGATHADKWAIEKGAFAIGLGMTLGSMPDLGYAFGAKVLMIVALPGPQILLNGRGGFLAKLSSGDTIGGMFEALLVLDVPGKMFQAGLSALVEIQAGNPGLLSVGGGIDVAFTWADNPPPEMWHLYLGESSPAERRIHAKIFKVVEGDTWLMVNRPGTLARLKAADPARLGEVELGGSIAVGGNWQFGPVRAWLQVGMEGGAGISSHPEQFTGFLRVFGGAGLSVFCFSIEAGIEARADAMGPTPWWLHVEIALSIKIDLFLWRFERRVPFPMEWGGKQAPLPEPVTDIAHVAAEHPKADEDRPLSGAIVPGDARPLITFDRPVADRARFGGPGLTHLTPEDKGARTFSYQLRHLVLQTAGGKLIGAAGETVVAGTTATFPGLAATGPDALPDLAGAVLTLVDDMFTERGTYQVTGGSGTTAQLAGTPPAGTFGYRLSAPRAAAQVEVTAIAADADGTAVLTLAAAPADPGAFQGGQIVQGAASWPVVSSTAAGLRVRASGPLPTVGAAGLSGPDPSTLEAAWYATAAPGDASANTRLSIGARTPFAFYRRNDLHDVRGLDPFTGPYACGPEPVERPICLDLVGVPVGPLTGDISIDGVPATVTGTAGAAGGMLHLGDLSGATGTLVLHLAPGRDQVWITAAAGESGSVTARRGGGVIGQKQLGHNEATVLFSGDVDEVEITGTAVRVTAVCYLPGWTCTTFDAVTFPHGGTGPLTYAGLELTASGPMAVTGGVLEIGGTPATLTVMLPQPVTRVRVHLESDATVAVHAGEVEVDTAGGLAGRVVQLVADPHGPAHVGWCDRITVTGQAAVRLTEICTDAGPFGWQRYEQWRWSKGIQRSVEAMYRPDPVLRPGTYRLRVRTATVIGGTSPEERFESAEAAFTVGEPPGFATGGTSYPGGGPLTELSTYVAGTVPASGARPWYRGLDTGVLFTDGFITRMYLQTGRELRVVVRDASGRVVRGPAPHHRGTTELSLDAWSWEWVRTLNGDGTDPCATVDLDRVTRPESLLAGGEPLRPAQLHRSELVASTATASTPVHAFEFVTSRFMGLIQHLATFDGRCRPRSPLPGASLAGLAAGWRDRADRVASLVTTAVADCAAAHTGTPAKEVIDRAEAAYAALLAGRVLARSQSAAEFGTLWSAWFGDHLPSDLPPGCLLSAVALPGGYALLLESPEPLAWDRIEITATRHADRPFVRARSAPTRAFGRPDEGFSVVDGGVRWRAGAELWVRDGAVRPRAGGEPLDVTVSVDRAISMSLTLALDDGAMATLMSDPPHPAGPKTVPAPPGGGTVEAMMEADGVRGVSVTGAGVGVTAVEANRPFAPSPPTGDLRIAGVALPGVQPKDHHVTLVAMAPVPSLSGWTLRWIDAVAPGEPVLYAELPDVPLGDGERLRLFPGLSEVPPGTNVPAYAGGPGEDPPAHGVVLQLVDPEGTVAHETAAMPPCPGAPVRVVSVEDHDGTRALLLPVTGAGFPAGWWALTVTARSDAGPDVLTWTSAGAPANQTAVLAFLLE